MDNDKWEARITWAVLGYTAAVVAFNLIRFVLGGQQ
jgi:hypothetical protein